MNRFSLYIIVVLIFLGLSKGPNYINKTEYAINVNSFEKLLNETPPYSVVLIDYFSYGVFIKSYYHKYKIIAPNHPSAIKVYRVSREFYESNLLNLGLSLFEINGRRESIKVPVPPGFIYIHDPIYGEWKVLDSNIKTWVFNRNFLSLERQLGLTGIEISSDFFLKAKILIEQERPFYGIHDEYGSKGVHTQKFIGESLILKDPYHHIPITHYLKIMFKMTRE